MLPRHVRIFTQSTAVIALTVVIVLSGTGVALSEEATLTIPASSPDTQPSISDGAKVVIAFNIIVPDANATIADNLAQFEQGKHELLPALERELNGLKPGDQKRVELTPEQAFGPYDKSKRMTKARTELPTDLRPGTVLNDSQGRPFTVVSVNDANAVIDYNHPLAGQRLQFDMRVLKVEKPS